MRFQIIDNHRSYLMGFAILWIIAFHWCFYSNLIPNPVLGFVFGKGYLGVDIFLFLSSYGLCYSYTSKSIAQFYKSRVKRLYPMYLLFLLVLFLFFGYKYKESSVVLALFQITGIASFRQVDVEWYIPALTCLYLLFPLLFIGIRKIYKTYHSWGIILLIFALNVLAEFFGKVLFPAFAQRLGIIIVGVVTYFAFQNNDRKSIVVLFSCCALFAFLFKCTEQQTGSMLVPILLLVFSYWQMPLPLDKIISFCGKHSLELYLAQSLALNQYFLSTDGSYILKCLFALIIIVFMASVLYVSQCLFYKLVRV